MYSVNVKVKKLRNNAIIPMQGTSGAAGFDLTISAFLDADGNTLDTDVIRLDANHTTVVRCATGLAMEIPQGYCMKILPRSGMACKEGITVTNSPGLIDSDYRGEIIVCVTKHHDSSSKDSWLSVGDRVAQATIEQVVYPMFEAVKELSETDRGDGAFGSSGKKDVLYRENVEHIRIEYYQLIQNNEGQLYPSKLNQWEIIEINKNDDNDLYKINEATVIIGDRYFEYLVGFGIVREKDVKDIFENRKHLHMKGDTIGIISTDHMIDHKHFIKP